MHISSDLEDLETLHLRLGWTPGKLHIRPTEEIIEKKKVWGKEVLSKWVSIDNFIYHDVFNLNADKGSFYYPQAFNKKMTFNNYQQFDARLLHFCLARSYHFLFPF